MSEHSVLGSIDPKLGDTPGSSLIKTVADKPTAKIDDRTLILADVGRKAIVQSSGRKGGADPSTICGAASAVAETLTSGTWTHDYPIWASGRTSFGVPVSTDMPDNLLEPLKLYPQPVRTQSSGGVEYLPVERRASEGRR